MNITEKLDKLKDIISSVDSALIAFSGGVDSTLLAKLANDILGEKALAVTANSATYTPSELEEATAIAANLGLNHQIIETSELEDESFLANPPERCYHCKKELMTVLKVLAANNDYHYIFDGANVDDLLDFRPGSRASKEAGVRSPLQEAGLTKEEIRQLSKDFGLPTWNKPAMACLASRIPYGNRITPDKLRKVYHCEQFLGSLGFSPVRVRDYGDLARIELSPGHFKLAISARESIISEFMSLGYTYVTLDLAGFRSGSMNEVLGKEHQNG